MTSWYGKVFTLLALCQGNPPFTGGWPSQRATKEGLLCVCVLGGGGGGGILAFKLTWYRAKAERDPLDSDIHLLLRSGKLIFMAPRLSFYVVIIRINHGYTKRSRGRRLVAAQRAWTLVMCQEEIPQSRVHMAWNCSVNRWTSSIIVNSVLKLINRFWYVKPVLSLYQIDDIRLSRGKNRISIEKLSHQWKHVYNVINRFSVDYSGFLRIIRVFTW